MAKQPLPFTGAATALITPFTETGEVDFPALERLIEFQIQNGIDALVVLGTTGENVTLSDDERRAVIRFSVKCTAKRVPLIIGTGSNDTAHALSLSRYAAEEGADGLLIVTPYYNKTTPEGLIRHYTTIADEVDCPILLYNIPSRTGLSIPLSVYEVLAKHDNIVAVKEASDNIVTTADLAALPPPGLGVYSGNDDRIVPILSLGGSGVISVLSNLLPGEVHEMCQSCLTGDFQKGAALQLRYLPLIRALFCEVNPIPVKAACAMMGLCGETLRMPLCPISDANRRHLARVLSEFGLIDR